MDETAEAEMQLHRGIMLGWKLAAVHLAGKSKQWADSTESLDELIEAIEQENL